MQKTLFLTGKLAHEALKKILESINIDKSNYKVKEIGVNVAALMTQNIIKNRINEDDLTNIELIMLPGKCKVNLDELSSNFGIPVILGPEELKDLPEFLNKNPLSEDLTKYDINIIAEIYNAPYKSTQQLIELADYYIANGADVIDIGCLPDTEFPHLEEIISILSAKGYQTSLDSLNPRELIRAGNAGAKYLLSLSEATLWVANETSAVPIIIPQTPNDMDSLKRSIYCLEESGKNYIADPILYPINCGMVNSLKQYIDLRNEFPNIELLMGVGNVTELVEADSLGINVIFSAIAAEIGVNYLLTSQLNKHCRSVIKELNLARRVLYLSKQFATLPQGFTKQLMALHDKNPFPHTEDEITEIYNKIKDPSYRINITDSGLHIFNRENMISTTDPFNVLSSIGFKGDVSHAYYLGYEIAKAEIAWKLGKRYNQDQPLDFGCLTEQMIRHKYN